MSGIKETCKVSSIRKETERRILEKIDDCIRKWSLLEKKHQKEINDYDDLEDRELYRLKKIQTI